MQDILIRLRESSANESSHELQCRCFDAANEIERLRTRLQTIADGVYSSPEVLRDLARDGLRI